MAWIIKRWHFKPAFQPEPYYLYCGEKQLGRVTFESSEFPSHFGSLELNEDWEEGLNPLAIRYVKIQRGDLKEDEILNEEFDQILEWILKTDDWQLRDADEIHLILPPTIRPDYISWRFNENDSYQQ